MTALKHFLSCADLTGDEIKFLIEQGIRLKKNPKLYNKSLTGKTLLMFFAKPSLRTRLSFETAMTQLGGQAIYYDIADSPLGKGKETIADTAKAASLYADIIMARLFEHKDIRELAENSGVSVINGLTNLEHPCQILADLMTIQEIFGKLKGLELVYLGDGNNNVTHSLILACALTGINIGVASPPGEEFQPAPDIVKQAMRIAVKNKSKIIILVNPGETARGADILVTDSWMSYHISKEQERERQRILAPYQVNQGLMKKAKPQAIFMHCLPATRGQEVAAEVIDGKQSVVWQEAENRLHIQKAILLFLIGKI